MRLRRSIVVPAVIVLALLLCSAFGLGYRMGRGRLCAEVAMSWRSSQGETLRRAVSQKVGLRWRHALQGQRCTLTATWPEAATTQEASWRYDVESAKLFAHGTSAASVFAGAGLWADQDGAQVASHAPPPVSGPGDLSLLLLGSGFALYVALLAWSDQIQSLRRDTRELQSKFVTATKIDGHRFIDFLETKDPDRQIELLNVLLQSAELNKPANAEVVGQFLRWDAASTELARLSLWKYRLTVCLTLYLLVAGVIGVVTSLLHWPLSPEADMWLAAGAALLIFLGVGVVIHWNARERAFHDLVGAISAKVL